MLTRGLIGSCSSFPCHEGMEDCTFCYCPFYPCLDGEKGKFVFSKKTGERVWDCSGCLWIHKKRVAGMIFSFLRGRRRLFFKEQ